MDAIHGDITKYLKHVALPANQHEHGKFLSSLKEWIRQHNNEPNKTKLASKKALSEVQTVLDIQHKRGGRFEKPKREFVLVEHWDENEDGKFEQDKVVEETIFGKTCKGIWKDLGSRGRFVYTDFEEGVVVESSREHNGEGPFAKQALEATKRFSWMHSTRSRRRGPLRRWRRQRH